MPAPPPPTVGSSSQGPPLLPPACFAGDLPLDMEARLLSDTFECSAREIQAAGAQAQSRQGAARGEEEELAPVRAALQESQAPLTGEYRLPEGEALLLVGVRLRASVLLRRRGCCSGAALLPEVLAPLRRCAALERGAAPRERALLPEARRRCSQAGRCSQGGRCSRGPSAAPGEPRLP